jgi:hypothetical protein
MFTSLNRQMIEQQSRMLQNAQGMKKQRAVGLVLGQAALNWGMMDRLLGSGPDKTVAQLRSMVGPTLNRLIKNTLDGKRMFVTHVVQRAD